MNRGLRNPARLVPFVVCVALGSLVPAFGQDKQDPIAALFEGIPADLRGNIGTNSVRRDRVNDWLEEHVDGKGKTVDLRVPGTVTAMRGADKTYTVQVILRKPIRFGVDGPPARLKPPVVAIFGDTWPVLLKDGSGYQSNFGFVGVSTEDAEKLVEVKEIRIQGKVKSARVDSDDISLTLEDVSVDGKKLTPLTPRKMSPRSKGRAGGGGPPA